MQFSTKTIFAVALLATQALARPADSQGSRNRKFLKCQRPTPTPEPVVAAIEATTAPPPPPPTSTAEAVIVTPTPTPTPEPQPEVVVAAAEVPSPAPVAVQALQHVAAPKPQPTQQQDDSEYANSGLSADFQAGLKSHNDARAAAGMAPLTHSASLAAEAQAYAQQLVAIGSLQHAQDRNGHGENLYWQSQSSKPCENGSTAWADEKNLYGGQPVGQGNFAAYGHYTQMIWKTTTEVGFGTASDGKGGVYVVARYNPAGNMVGKTPSTA